MSETKHIELWNKCREIIRDNIPAEQYDVWFRDITSYEFINDRLTLVVPSSFYVEQFEERYIKILSPALKRVYGENVQLFYRYFQVKGQSDTAVNVLSTNPSPTILDQQRAKVASPFNNNNSNCDLDTQLNARYTFDNYCTGDSNKIAVAIGMSIADNPKNRTFNPLFVFGDTGVGKTHLIQAIGILFKEKMPQSRVLYVTARLFESQYTAAVVQKTTNDFFHFYQSIDTLIIDDVQDFHGKPATQNTFFHIFNHLHQLNKQIILSSDCAPAEMDGFEVRLLSRFKWGMSVELDHPDIELRRQVLLRKAQEAGLVLPPEVIEYIITSITSSIRELEGVMVSLVAHATIMNTEITLGLAKKVIEHAVKINRKPINFELITEEVCAFYKIDPSLIFTKTRQREVSDARQVVMYLAKTMAKMPLVAIGHRIDRTHATVNHACNAVESRLGLEKKFQSEIAQIKAAILDTPCTGA